MKRETKLVISILMMVMMVFAGGKLFLNDDKTDGDMGMNNKASQIERL